MLPDTPVAWRGAWPGGLLAAALFKIGKSPIGLYLGRSGIASAYGAAGSLVIIMLWVYCSAQIVLFAAEFSHACAVRRHARRAPGARRA